MEDRQIIFLLILICSVYLQMLADGTYERMVGQRALNN